MADSTGSAVSRSATESSWNPLRVTGTDMPPNLLLASKLIVVAFFANGQLSRIPGTFLPFFSVLDRIGSRSAFQSGLQAAFLVAAAALLLNRRPNIAAVVAGGVILCGTISSRLYFENNTEYTGLILLLCGLSVWGDRTRLVRYQVVLLYAAAAVNKLLDADWRTGQFFENWATVTSLHAAYHHVSTLLPHLVLAKLLAWSAILTETALAIGFAVRRLFPYAIWLAVGYHSTLMLITGRTFGMFYFALMASYLAFARPWPEHAGLVNARGWVGRLRVLDTEHAFGWQARGDTLVVDTGQRELKGTAALGRVLRYTPPAWFAFWIVAAVPQPDITHRLIALLVLTGLAVVAVTQIRDVWAHRSAFAPVAP
jgi:hypothetical protein